MTWREQIVATRETVHETMALACLHVSPDGSSQAAARVRYHYSRGALSVVPGQDSYGERLALPTDVIFDQREFMPSRKDLLVFESGEVVQVDTVYPPDVRTDFRRANVAPVEAAVMAAHYPFLTSGQPWAGLTYPE